MSRNKIALEEILGERIIDELRRLFHEATGMVIGFSLFGRDSKANFYPEEERCSFCKLIVSAAGGRQRCLQCDKAAIKEAYRLKTPHIYTCHAGLTDFVVPLLLNGKLVGILVSGQLLTSKPTASGFVEVWNKTRDLGVDRKRLRKAYDEVKFFSRKNLDFAVRLLSLIANYIVEKESAYVFQKELVRRQGELLKEARKKDELRRKLKEAWPFLRLETLSEKDQTRRERIAKEAKHFIETHYAEPLTLEIVSEAVFLSPSYFSTLFKEYAGIGFAEYLARVRMEKAKELLERLDLNVTEICWKVGYEDPNYFSQAFRKVTGLRPSEYRKKVLPA